MNALSHMHHPRQTTHENTVENRETRLKIFCPFLKGLPVGVGILNSPPQAVPLFQVKEDKKRRQPKIFHLSDCVEITEKDMPKRSDRIGCNDSPYSISESTNGKYDWKIFWRVFFATFVTLDKSGPPEAKSSVFTSISQLL